MTQKTGQVISYIRDAVIVIAMIILLVIMLRECDSTPVPVLISSDTSTVKKKEAVKQPDISVAPEAKVIIKYRDRIIYKDRIFTDSSLRIDTLLKDLEIIASADTTVISPMTVGDTTVQDTTRIKATFRLPENRMQIDVTRKPFYYTSTTKTITNSFVTEKPKNWLENLLYLGTGFAAGVVVDRIIR